MREGEAAPTEETQHNTTDDTDLFLGGHGSKDLVEHHALAARCAHLLVVEELEAVGSRLVLSAPAEHPDVALDLL